MSDEVCLQVVDLYLSERKRGAAGGNLSSQCVRAAWETSYQWKAERVMAEENCFKVTVSKVLDIIFIDFFSSWMLSLLCMKYTQL